MRPLVVTAGLLAPLLLGASAAVHTKHPAPESARVEVQISLCDDPDHIVRALDLRTSGAAFETWLFDDTRLTLFGRGVRFRLRVGARDAELTLKAATDDCTALRGGHIPADQGKCEYDLHGERIGSAVSLRRTFDANTAHELLAGRLALSEALSPAQVRYLDETLHLWPLPGDIRPLGPIKVQSYRTHGGTRYDVDISYLPDRERYVEISRKVAYAQAAPSHAALDKVLADAGVAACTDQSAQAGNKLRSLLPPTAPGAKS
jgi:hypothetical protein